MIKKPVRYVEREKVVVDLEGKAVCSVSFVMGITQNEMNERGNEIAEALNAPVETSEPATSAKGKKKNG